MKDTEINMKERNYRVGDIIEYKSIVYYVVGFRFESNWECHLMLVDYDFERVAKVKEDDPEIKFLGHYDDFHHLRRSIYAIDIEPHNGDMVIRKKDGVRGIVLLAGKMPKDDIDFYPHHMIAWQDGTITKEQRPAFEMTRINVIENNKPREDDYDYEDDEDDEE